MKFRVKMIVCMVGLLSFLFGVGGSILLSLSFQNSLKWEKDAAWRSYQMVLNLLQIVSEQNQPLDYNGISRTLGQLGRQNANFCAALRLEIGTEIIYESGAAAAAIDSKAARPQPENCLFRYAMDASGAHWLILSGAVAIDGNTLYLHTVHDITALYEARAVQQRTFQWVFAGMALLCAVLSGTVSRMLTAPLEGLSRATRAIASGRYASRVQITSGDEIAAVSADFNAMAKQLESVIAELRDAVVRQEDFMGSFAHELKTPMTSIIGYAELILGETLNKEEQFEAAKYIFSEGKRLESLSRKLLNLLVLEKSDLILQPVRPADLIEAMAAEMRPVYRVWKIKLFCRCEDGMCLLEPDLVRSLLLNLMDNARKAMERGGNIALFCKMTKDGCRICVRDDGPGIPQEALSHLTEAFYRVDKSRSREQGGAGLGLTLCQKIAEFHNGSIRVESQAGQGACVVADLKGGRA